VERDPYGGAVGPLGGGQFVCMRDLLALNEIWEQDDLYF
jgi:hypothetical protein